MRIIYDSTIFNLQKYGGISRYFNEIIERVRKYSGVDADIFKGFKGRLARFNGILIENKFKTGKYGIYHPTYYSCLVKKRKDIKIVVTVYDMIHELYLQNTKGFDSDITIKKESIMNADHIICISSNTKKDLQNIYGISDEDVSVIYLGAPLALERINIEKARIQISDKPYILYVGSRQLYKNFKMLLKAFHALNIKSHFNLVCFGGRNFSKEETSEFKKMKLESSIKYVEGPDNLMQLYYENAHIFIYPSIYEGFGLPVLEAMAFGCPVIASNTSSIPEITDNAALLFSPDKADELCDCISRITNDKKIREDYIERGRKRSEKFSWDRTAEETLKVYRELLS